MKEDDEKLTFQDIICLKIKALRGDFSLPGPGLDYTLLASHKTEDAALFHDVYFHTNRYKYPKFLGYTGQPLDPQAHAIQNTIENSSDLLS